MRENNPCPCGTGQSFQVCCGELISNKRQARTAVELMRSRFTANRLKNIEYLLRTWHPDTRPLTLNEKAIPDWTELEIIHVRDGFETDREGSVEFRACAVNRKTVHVLHEISRFVHDGNTWYYKNGEIKEASSQKNHSLSASALKNTGRNNPCPCGSGKKYKKCCRM